MQFTLIGLACFVLWFLALVRGIPATTGFTLLLIPLGAAAAITVDGAGLSILCLQLCACLTMGVQLLNAMVKPESVKWQMQSATAVLFVLCIYGAVSAFFFPRFFQGDILVVPYGVILDGLRVSDFFHTTVVALQPSSSNIAQPAYLFASLGFLMVMNYVGERRGATYLSNAVLAAGLVNVVLGVMDALRLAEVLAFVRTADYSIYATWQMHGINRLVGGFPEPSAFGSISIVLGAYGLSLFVDRRDLGAGAIGILNTGLGLMALSSTAYIGLAVLALWLVLRTLFDAVIHRRGRRAAVFMVFWMPMSVVALILLNLSPAAPLIDDLLRTLIFEKAESQSGLERGYWAMMGLRTFAETYGLGAGLGSVRANGLISVLLGNIGAPGAILFAAFIALTFARRLPKLSPAFLREGERDRHLFRAASSGAVVMMPMLLTSATVVDPGILFMAFSSIALTVRAALRADLIRAQSVAHDSIRDDWTRRSGRPESQAIPLQHSLRP